MTTGLSDATDLSEQPTFVASAAPEPVEPDGAEMSPAVVPRFLQIGAAWAWRIVIVAAAVYVLAWVVVRLRTVLLPVFVAVILASLLTPVVDRLDRHMPRLVATWLTIVGTLGALAGLIAGLWGPISSSVGDLADQFDDVRADLRTWLADGPLGLSDSRIDDVFDRVGNRVDDIVSGIWNSPASTARTVGEFAAGALLALVLLFFTLNEGPAMWKWFVDRIRPVRRDRIDQGGRAAFTALHDWVRGVAITGVVDGVLIGAAMLVLGVPAAIPLAVLTVFAAFLPIIGATVSGMLAVSIALVAEGPTDAIILAVVVLAVQQIEGNVLMPVIMRRQVNLHPVVVLVVLTAGAALGGIVGALVAVPLTAAGVAAVTTARKDHVIVPEELELAAPTSSSS